jgi:hypothetical protein
MSTPLGRAQAKLDEIEIKEALISGCILSRMRNAQHRLRMERFCIPNSSCGPAIMIMRRLLEPQLPQRTRGTFGAANGTLRHNPPRRRRGVKPIEPRLRGAAVLFRWRRLVRRQALIGLQCVATWIRRRASCSVRNEALTKRRLRCDDELCKGRWASGQKCCNDERNGAHLI